MTVEKPFEEHVHCVLKENFIIPNLALRWGMSLFVWLRVKVTRKSKDFPFYPTLPLSLSILSVKTY